MFHRLRRYYTGGELPHRPHGGRRRPRIWLLRSRRGYTVNLYVGLIGAVVAIILGHLRQNPVEPLMLGLVIIAALLIPVHLTIYASAKAHGFWET